MAFPSRADIRSVLVALCEGSLSAADADAWATRFVVDDAIHPDVMDEVVWDGLQTLSGASLQTAPGVPLHGPEDHIAWLAAFDRASEGR